MRSTSAGATAWSRRCAGLGLDSHAAEGKPVRLGAMPEGVTSIEFAGRLLDDTGVVVTPGIGYGQYGEGYIRLR